MMTLRALPPLLLLLFWMVLLLLLLDGVRPCSPLAWKSAKILSMSIMPGSVWRRSEERRSLMSAGMSSGVSAADGEDALDEDCGDGVEDEEEDEDGDELPWELVDAEVFSTWMEI